MKIVCAGGGPAGLYTALLTKKRHPDWDVRVIERNRPFDTFGWGVVFSDATLDNLRAADAPTHDAIVASFAHWDDIEIFIRDRAIRSGGHGFAGIARKRLLTILQERAAEVGVALEFETEINGLDAYADADVMIAADGANSRIRNARAEAFRPSLDTRKCRYVWLGTTLPLDAFTFFFEETEHGWFAVHAYRFQENVPKNEPVSTFIVECREETWRAHGLDTAETAETITFCERPRICAVATGSTSSASPTSIGLTATWYWPAMPRTRHTSRWARVRSSLWRMPSRSPMRSIVTICRRMRLRGSWKF